jgi:hypothetical protein
MLNVDEKASVRLFSRGKKASEPIVFVGEPSKLHGELWLENEEKEDIAFRRGVIHASSIQGTGGRAELARLPVPAVLRAHERKLLEVSFEIDKATVPGTYDAAILLESDTGHKKFPAKIIVFQLYKVSFDPAKYVITASSGSSVPGEVMVWNRGNVSVQVVPMGEFVLKDPTRPECCCEKGEEEDADDNEFGSIVLTNDRLTIEPGNSSLVKYTIKVPESLPANSHLRAMPRIGNARFQIDIITTDEKVTPPRRPASVKRK